MLVDAARQPRQTNHAGAMREARDATLAVPRLLLPSVQVNIRAGRLPPAEDNGVSYLRIPVKPVTYAVGGEAAS